MSITDELREWVRNHVAELNICGVDERDLKEIADRIDEQHRKALEKVSAMVDKPDYFGTIIDANSTPKRVDALELRVSVLERKLNHKG